MSKLLLTFYGDDFTGSTDALEQLANFGIRAMLFIEPPTPAQLKRFPNLQAIGVAGMTRAMTPKAMEKELRPAFKKLQALGARHVHYKVCSTFDSSPTIGSIGRVMDVAAEMFHAPFVPLLVAAPALGRYTVFGNHFARFGIGSEGAICRLDRQPSISRHPITPMGEADLRLHLAKQTIRKIALFDILKITLPRKESRVALKKILAGKPPVVLFDAVDAAQLSLIGGLIDEYATTKQPLFSVGSSGIEIALGAHWGNKRPAQMFVKPVKQLLVGSGSCSSVTENQIAWALKNDFAEVSLDVSALAGKQVQMQILRATQLATKHLLAGRSVMIHTTKCGSDKRLAAKLKNNSAKVLGTALGTILRATLAQARVQRLCIAGGDTSSFAARALGITALEMVAPLTPGAPLCRAFAPGSPAAGLEVVFKGGQVGAENYFDIVKRGKI
jgi:uncharacterized protein YgbK (DUF1537 family)